MTATGSLPSHHPDIRVERDEHVATIALDRPESKNACTSHMWSPRTRIESIIVAGDGSRLRAVVARIAEGPPITLSMTKPPVFNRR